MQHLVKIKMIGYNPAGSQDKSRMYIREIVLSRMGFGFIQITYCKDKPLCPVF